jgi:hypothetical protein
LALFSEDLIIEPTTYEEELNCERKEDQIKWKDNINKELKEIAKEVYRKLLMRNNSKLIVDASRINGYSR